VALLLKRMAAGEVVLERVKDNDILRTMLRELKVPVESQVLVFSRTSLQAGRHPAHAPARCFSRTPCTWAGLPGALIEVAAIDPELGPVFYSFDPQDARDAKSHLCPRGVVPALPWWDFCARHSRALRAQPLHYRRLASRCCGTVRSLVDDDDAL
jgi:hypothetical protein